MGRRSSGPYKTNRGKRETIILTGKGWGKERANLQPVLPEGDDARGAPPRHVSRRRIGSPAGAAAHPSLPLAEKAVDFSVASASARRLRREAGADRTGGGIYQWGLQRRTVLPLIGGTSPAAQGRSLSPAGGGVGLRAGVSVFFKTCIPHRPRQGKKKAI